MRAIIKQLALVVKEIIQVKKRITGTDDVTLLSSRDLFLNFCKNINEKNCLSGHNMFIGLIFTPGWLVT